MKGISEILQMVMKSQAYRHQRHLPVQCRRVLERKVSISEDARHFELTVVSSQMSCISPKMQDMLQFIDQTGEIPADDSGPETA